MRDTDFYFLRKQKTGPGLTLNVCTFLRSQMFQRPILGKKGFTSCRQIHKYKYWAAPVGSPLLRRKKNTNTCFLLGKETTVNLILRSRELKYSQYTTEPRQTALQYILSFPRVVG